MDIIGIDSSCVDHIVSIDRMPHKDEEIEMHRQSWQSGGKIATALAAAARLGAETALMGRLGDDALGDFILADLAADGVDTARMEREAGKTSCYCISLAEKETKGRSFIVQWGSHRPYGPADLDPAFIQSAKCLHLFQMDEVNRQAALAARAAGRLVGFDGDMYDEAVMEHIGLIDIFIGSEFFYDALFKGAGTVEENCRKVQAMGPGTVIFTFGPRGCAGVGAEGFFELDAFPAEVVDTTGAGDVFHGAFLFATVCKGMAAKEAAAFANCVAAAKCMFMGGRAGLPTWQQATAFMATGVLDEAELRARERKYQTFRIQGA